MIKVFIFLSGFLSVVYAESSAHSKSNVKELKSNLGVRFWFMKDESAPLVHVKIAFKNAGSSYQDPTKTGVPEFYANSVFSGSGQYSKVEFEKACSDISVLISCKASVDTVSFSLTSPKIVLKDAAPLFKLAVCSPAFEKEKIKKVQSGMIYSLQNYAIDPIGVATDILVPSIIFRSHIYEKGCYGSSEDFMKLSVDDLKNYKNEFLVINNAEACVFGDITESEAIELLDNIFNGLKRGNRTVDNVIDIIPQLNSNDIKKYYVEGGQSTIVFTLHNEKPLSKKRYIAVILYSILGGAIFKSRIMSELRTNKGLIYRGGISFVDLNHANYVLGILQTDNSKVEQTINSLKEIIKNLREKGITESDLNFAKSNIEGSMLVNFRTSGDFCKFYFQKMIHGLGINVLSEILNGVRNVKLEEVNDLAKEMLNEEKMPLIVIGGNE